MVFQKHCCVCVCMCVYNFILVDLWNDSKDILFYSIHHPDYLSCTNCYIMFSGSQNAGGVLIKYKTK